MKHLNLILLFLLPFIACSNDKANDPPTGDVMLTCLPEKVEANATKEEYTLNITCNGEWTAYASDDCTSWVAIKVNGALNKQGTVIVTVHANNGQELRNGSVVIKSGTKRITIPITQEAPMSVSKSEIYAHSTGETLILSIVATQDWNVKSNDSWMKAEKTDSKTVAVTTEPNDNKTSRKGTLEVTSGTEKITVSVIQESAEDRDINTPEGYRLVWHDEFNEGTTLGSDWTHEVQGPGWVNNELQTYVNGSADNKRVTELVDGKLNINCFKGSDGKIYSGRVYAKVSKGWLYGYFEARIQLPKGKGTWPAFWMMPVNNNFSTNPWPGCGEIDIMEEVGVDANIVSSSIHTQVYNHTIGTQKTASRNIGTAESEFHVYACEWTPEYLKFFVDGTELMTFANEGTGKSVWPFTYAFYPILNLAWGGDWGGYKGVDETALPVTMKIDYIRVFQKQ
ncbi:family 16 glycosylhydrolase [Bacteroides sp. 519]|uniref:family 16 glycosylhydrolase n=1 Tax=Bacteroides sp. 519 TaxID=2302937 RepID=UPI0013D44F01|nr:family 16 glycosylhydrolase [Bacteroides sp. 519]NDV59122.1 beta-glucanase [Bacteroides sp. 519]